MARALPVARAGDGDGTTESQLRTGLGPYYRGAKGRARCLCVGDQ